MAWLGESFANIKGQITSFTKEVLTADDDDERKLFDMIYVYTLLTYDFILNLNTLDIICHLIN